MAGQTFVIIGGGLAGAKAAETLRAEGFDGRVVVVTAEDELPYERPPLSKGYLLGKEPREKAFVHPAEWYTEQRVELVKGTATALDAAAHEVRLTDGQHLTYDKILLTTGSHPRRLDVPGAELDGVRYLRYLPDADVLRGELREGRRVVIVGAGWIGLEVAAAAREHRADATVVEVAALPLQRVVGDAVAGVFRDLHEEHGVRFRFGTGIERVTGDRAVTGVVTTMGEDLPADVVVVGVGITPVTDLAQGAGLAVEDGVVVDASLCTSEPDVFAAGDVASAWHPHYGRRLRVEHWANALNGGPAAARAMLGQEVTYDRLPYFFSDQYDLGLEYVGWTGPGEQDDVVLRGDVPGRAFHAFWLGGPTGDEVRAGMHVNLWDDGIDPVRELVGRRVDRARLADVGGSLGAAALPG